MTNATNTNDVKQNNVDIKSFYISIYAPLMGLQEFQKYVQDGYVLDISQSPRKRGNNVHLTLVKVTSIGGVTSNEGATPVDTVNVDNVVVEDKPKTTTAKKTTTKVTTKVADKEEVKDV